MNYSSALQQECFPLLFFNVYYAILLLLFISFSIVKIQHLQQINVDREAKI